jgi:TPR repeat protein
MFYRSVIYMDKKQRLLDLIDKAGKGSIEAAEEIAVGYYNGDFGEKNLAKARKWASYAAKHGSEKAQEIIDAIG